MVKKVLRNNIMRGACCIAIILVTVSALMISVPSSAFGKEADQSDRELLTTMMKARGMNEMLNAELLFDRHGDPSFAMGRSSDGYLIAERETGLFMEQGGGAGPYSEDADTKYYGGFMCYAEESSGELTDPVTGAEIAAVPYCPAAEDAIERCSDMSSCHDTPAEKQSNSVLSSKFLSNSSSKIKSIAFGDNDGEYLNTCSAVALGIALNYLDYTFDSRVVPSAWEHEARTTPAYSSSYIGATALHHYLVDDCGMSPTVPIINIDLGVWGPMVTAGESAYMQSDSARTAVGLEMDWSVINESRTVECIDKDIPAIITTTLTTFGSDEGIDYGGHSMVAYGYRTMSDDSVEINLHSGWYISDYYYNNGYYYISDIWAPNYIATFRFGFSLSNGWHYSGSGKWRYYENDVYVTGWKSIDNKTYYFGNDGNRTTGYKIMNGMRYLFDSNGVLVSQTPINSPFTGTELSADSTSSANWGFDSAFSRQCALQSTGYDEIPAMLKVAMEKNQDVYAWLYVPGTNVSLPVAQHGDDEEYYLNHGIDGNVSPYGTAFSQIPSKRDFSDSLTVLYGHSFPNVALAFSQLHLFENPDFFTEHKNLYVYLPGRKLSYKVVSAVICDSQSITKSLHQDNPAEMQDYFDKLSDKDPRTFKGVKRRDRLTLDALRDHVLQLSTCTLPASFGKRFIVTAVLESEE